MLQMLRKHEAENLLRQAISEIETEGVTTEEIVVNKKRKTTAPNMYLVEVGVVRNETTSIPSNDSILRVPFNDEFLKLVDRYQQVKLAAAM